MTPPETGTELQGRVLREALAVLRARRGPLPVVTVSWAQSASGAIATEAGKPLLLSGPESMLLTHRLRAMHDAILVGIQTVLADDPLLSVRVLPEPRPHPQPQPVVLDSRLRFPLAARLLARQDRKPWIFSSSGPESDGSEEKARALEERGARLFRVSRGPGGLDLYPVLQALAAAGITSLMVEGGAKVLRAFITAGFAEQLVVTVSPSPVPGLQGPDMPGLVQSVTEMCGADSVTWGTLNP
jgi:riboflavin-specific deaminase-like protein